MLTELTRFVYLLRMTHTMSLRGMMKTTKRRGRG